MQRAGPGVEVKYRSRYAPIKIETDKLEKLIAFAERAGGRAYILVKYGREPWKVLDAAERVGREEYEKAVELRAFMESLLSAKIDQYF
jgi:Holliday junction resolvase - archaeal type